MKFSPYDGPLVFAG